MVGILDVVRLPREVSVSGHSGPEEAVRSKKGLLPLEGWHRPRSPAKICGYFSAERSQRFVWVQVSTGKKQLPPASSICSRVAFIGKYRISSDAVPRGGSIGRKDSGQAGQRLFDMLRPLRQVWRSAGGNRAGEKGREMGRFMGRSTVTERGRGEEQRLRRGQKHSPPITAMQQQKSVIAPMSSARKGAGHQTEIFPSNGIRTIDMFNLLQIGWSPFAGHSDFCRELF